MVNQDENERQDNEYQTWLLRSGYDVNKLMRIEITYILQGGCWQ